MNPAPPESLLQSVFDALPSLVFVVDEDVRIQRCNAAAQALLGGVTASLEAPRAGDALHCLNALSTPAGCGHSPFCRDCVVRNAVREARTGNRVVRQRVRMQLKPDGPAAEVFALVTATPFDWEGRPFVLLVLEDMGDLAEIQRFLPICCVCKKVRTDPETWTRIESYFHTQWDVQLSHGYCPECLVKEERRLLGEHAALVAGSEAGRETTDGHG